MIEVEGFKACKGGMEITPKCDTVKPFQIEGDWLYKPDTECWYGNGRSFSKDICIIVKEC